MKNKKGNVAVIALIIVVVAIVAAAGGWFAKKTPALVQKEVATQSAPAIQTQPTQTVTNQESSVKSAQDNLKSYSDSRVAYAFSYPASWKLDVNTSYESKTTWTDNEIIAQVQVGTLPDIGGLNIGDFNGKNIPSGVAINMEVSFDKALNQSIETYMKSRGGNSLFAPTDMIANGAKVFKYNPCTNKGACYSSDKSIIYEQDYVIISKPGYAYQIKTAVSMNGKESNDNVKKDALVQQSILDFQKVIQSLKFTK